MQSIQSKIYTFDVLYWHLDKKNLNFFRHGNIDNLT